MNEQGLQVPPQFVGVLEERNRIWEHYDSAHRNAAEFDTLARKVPNTGPSDEIALLTPEGIPPDEVRATITGLQKGLGQVSEEETRIKQLQEEIQRIRSNAQMMLVMIGLAIIVALGFAFTVIF